MSIKCVMLERTDNGDWRDPRSGDVRQYPQSFPAGAMWIAPYRETTKQEPRDACWVVLPNGAGPFCLESRAYHEENGKQVFGEPWAMTGTPPNVTLTPSINCVGIWHGWLTNGELTGDGV